MQPPSGREIGRGGVIQPVEQTVYRAFLVHLERDAAVDRLFEQAAYTPVFAGIDRIDHLCELRVGLLRMPADHRLHAACGKDALSPPREQAGALLGRGVFEAGEYPHAAEQHRAFQCRRRERSKDEQQRQNAEQQLRGIDVPSSSPSGLSAPLSSVCVISPAACPASSIAAVRRIESGIATSC